MKGKIDGGVGVSTRLPFHITVSLPLVLTSRTSTVALWKNRTSCPEPDVSRFLFARIAMGQEKVKFFKGKKKKHWLGKKESPKIRKATEFPFKIQWYLQFCQHLFIKISSLATLGIIFISNSVSISILNYLEMIFFQKYFLLILLNKPVHITIL